MNIVKAQPHQRRGRVALLVGRGGEGRGEAVPPWNEQFPDLVFLLGKPGPGVKFQTHPLDLLSEFHLWGQFGEGGGGGVWGGRGIRAG